MNRRDIGSQRLFQKNWKCWEHFSEGCSSTIKTVIMSDALFILPIMSDYWTLTTVALPLNRFCSLRHRARVPSVKALSRIKCSNVEILRTAQWPPTNLLSFFQSLPGSLSQSSSEHLNLPSSETEENLIRDAGEARDQVIEDRWERDQS